MEKPEYPPLLGPGFTEITLEDLSRLCVDPFPDPFHRRHLVARLSELVTLLREIGLECDIWIDGSFLTQDPEPSDVDMVIWSDNASRARLTVSQNTRLDKIIKNKDRTLYRYRCDVSYQERGNTGQRMYWLGCFGFSRGDQPKGIARLRLVPS
jgi:hypothetical protein